MKSDKKEIDRLISGMKSAYVCNENVMVWDRDNSTLADNTIVSTLISYDLHRLILILKMYKPILSMSMPGVHN
jgi:hypothetical protein